MQEKLLSRDEPFTLDVAMDIAKTREVTLADMQQFTCDVQEKPTKLKTKEDLQKLYPYLNLKGYEISRVISTLH